MILMTCVDDNGGLRFNHRRQSRDVEIYRRIAKRFSGKTVMMTPDSVMLFNDVKDQIDIKIAENGLASVGKDDIYFAEDGPLAPLQNKIDMAIIYRWNRAYPSDVPFDLDLSAFSLKEKHDFKGHSHDDITEEIYVR